VLPIVSKTVKRSNFQYGINQAEEDNPHGSQEKNSSESPQKMNRYAFLMIR
jgi:hypothetical protein